MVKGDSLNVFFVNRVLSTGWGHSWPRRQHRYLFASRSSSQVSLKKFRTKILSPKMTV